MKCAAVPRSPYRGTGPLPLVILLAALLSSCDQLQPSADSPPPAVGTESSATPESPAVSPNVMTPYGDTEPLSAELQAESEAWNALQSMGVSVGTRRPPYLSLNVMEDKKMTDDSMVHVAKLTHLQKLNLWGTSVTDAGLVHISGLKDLENLRVSGPKITDAGLEHARGLPKLKEVDLPSTAISDTSVQLLAEKRELRSLNLSGTAITDAGLDYLKGHPTLTNLLIVKCPNLTEGGIAALQASNPGLDISH